MQSAPAAITAATQCEPPVQLPSLRVAKRPQPKKARARAAAITGATNFAS